MTSSSKVVVGGSGLKLPRAPESLGSLPIAWCVSCSGIRSRWVPLMERGLWRTGRAPRGWGQLITSARNRLRLRLGLRKAGTASHAGASPEFAAREQGAGSITWSTHLHLPTKRVAERAWSGHLFAGGGEVHGSLGAQELWSASNLGNLVWGLDPVWVGESGWRQK